MEYYFIHKEWNDICIINNNNNSIQRKNIQNEYGYFENNNNHIIIKWSLWDDKDNFEKKNNIYIDTRLLKNIFFKLEKINLIKNNNHEECYLIDDNIISYKKNSNGKIEKIDNICIIHWNNDIKEVYIENNDTYYILEDYLKKKNIQNIKNIKNIKNQDKKILNHHKIEHIYENENEKIDDNKNIFKKINGSFCNIDYINKFIEKKYKLKLFDEKSMFNYNKNKNELYFNYFNKINNNYLDLENYHKYYNHYIINNENINKKYFEFESNIKINIEKNKKNIITLCEWGYPPFGGGENWLLNINKLFFEMGYQPFMICFSDGFNNKPFEEFNYIELDYLKIIQIPFDYFEIGKLIYLLDPLFINHQGIKRLEFMKLANIFEIPFFTGFCFWNNIITQVHSNINIMKNDDLKQDDSFKIITTNSFCYSASEFVNDVIEKFFQKRLNVIPTISLKDDYYIDNIQDTYVSMVNCHHNKGGFLLKELIEHLDIKIPLLLVYTEYDHHIPLSELKERINNRNEKNNVNILLEEKKDIKEIYKKTKIMLIPSLCDETFCRVAYECKMNQIQVISTNSGNLKYLMEDYAIILNDDILSWKENIEKIYFRKNKQKINKNIDLIEKNEKDIIYKLNEYIPEFEKSKYNLINEHVAIIAPWADQGLGIQARSYYHSLKEIHLKPFIFSFKPYHGNESNNFLQNESKEWDFENVYYSNNHREEIQIDELIHFIWSNKIKKILIIEATFEPIFKMMSFLKLLKIELYIVVNIECIKISEISNHLLFDKIFTNNYNSYHIMNNLIPDKCHYLGFHLEHDVFKLPIKSKKNDNFLNFVCVGGLNSISRKNIDKLLHVFLEIIQENNIDFINLNVYIQGVEIPPLLNDIKHKLIKININNYSYHDNLNNIKKNDIYIHLGGQEGLGLGFYEALYLGLPILTLDWSPNNELIFHSKNGWLVNCVGDKVHENNECIIKRGIFEMNDLKNTLLDIIENMNDTINIINYSIHNSKKVKIKNKKEFNTILQRGLF